MTEPTAEEKLIEQIVPYADTRNHAFVILDIIKRAGYKSPEEVAELLAKAREDLLAKLSQHRFASLDDWAKENGYKSPDG